LHHERDAHKELAELGSHAHAEFDKRMGHPKPTATAAARAPSPRSGGGRRRASVATASAATAAYGEAYHRSDDAVGLGSYEVRGCSNLLPLWNISGHSF
jgi:hypothetical protein